MKKTLTTLHQYGKMNSDNSIDFLIYIPHASSDATWISSIRETSLYNTDNFTDRLLQSYVYHEADIGMLEVAQSCIDNMWDIGISISILVVDIPRAICDMNRPFVKAIPPILDNAKWQPVYDDATSEISAVMNRSKFCLQLHSMCSFDPIVSFRFDESVSPDQMWDFLSGGYAGKRRQCNLLTSTTEGVYKSNGQYDTLLSEWFVERDIPLEYNTAYHLVPEYPSASIMDIVPSSFIEITKGSLANNDTIDMIDTNQIILNTDKINIFWEILAKSISQYTQLK